VLEKAAKNGGKLSKAELENVAGGYKPVPYIPHS
jgi:hypothetical protein